MSTEDIGRAALRTVEECGPPTAALDYCEASVVKSFGRRS